MKTVLSPLTGTSDVTFEKKISVEKIKQIYLDFFDVDTSNIFQDLDFVEIYKCNESGYRFYYPFHLSGDNAFYNKFGEMPWYYSDWKWEHEQCLNYIKPHMSVLEVGAAKGAFLIRIKEKLKLTQKVVGLELNTIAIEDARKNNVEMLDEMVQQHAESHKGEYDVVCSFQVLEHISDVHSFIKAKVDTIKKDGLMIISVPNNDSFLKEMDSYSAVLNLPPHHMGLWNKQSLTYLTKLFDLEVVDVLIEPLQPNNFANYQYVQVKKLLFNSNFLVKAFWKLQFHKLVRPFIKMRAKDIIGHSIMVVYKKTV